MMSSQIKQSALAALAGLALMATTAAQAVEETPSLVDAVKAGDLPPVEERLPAVPRIMPMDAPGQSIGKHGGEWRRVIAKEKNRRHLVVYGYARLVGYNHRFEMQPDILLDYDIKDGREFTLYLRPGHKWSDGHPFTTEDLRYWWEDVANNEELSPAGPPASMLVDGKPPVFEVLDETTLRFTWDAPNPDFLPKLAGASPLFIYRPAHYLKQFHAKYADKAKLDQLVKEFKRQSWASLHNKLDNLYRFDNPDLPTLQPWRMTTRSPATRFVALRNAYYHRVDAKGRQLPYLDRVVMDVTNNKLVPAKAGAGDLDLQARNINFSNYTFLKQTEAEKGFKVRLWKTAKGSLISLLPNLNVNDEGWRNLFRNKRFRHALSLGIDRDMINQTFFFGLGSPVSNGILPESPLYDRDRARKWSDFSPDQANQMLDDLGLTERNEDGLRLMEDGRPLEIIVETAGESDSQIEALQLIEESWLDLGVKLFIKPSQREVLRNRIFAGETQMSVWFGWENGVPSADMSPAELAPTMQQSLHWPKWGQFYESSGKYGEQPDIPEAQRLMDLYKSWRKTDDRDERQAIWQEMLDIHAEEQWLLGVINATLQPVVVNASMRNMPAEGIWNWDPGANFGIYNPDTFWYE